MYVGLLSALTVLWSMPAGPQVCSSTAPRVPDVTAFVDVSVIPMDTERVLPNHTVLVENGRIVRMGPANQVQIPAGAAKIDGRGRYLMPGLMDMHTHYDDMRHKPLQDIRNRQFRILAQGVTAVRELLPIPIAFMPLFEYLNSSSFAGPRVANAPHWDEFLGSATPRLDSIAAYLARYKAAGYDYVEVVFGNGPKAGWKEEVLDSILTAARRLKLPVSAHHGGAEMALKVGPAGGSVEHVNVWESTVDSQEAAALRRAGTWVSPTLDCHLDNSGNDARRRAVSALHKAGVKLLLGSDADWAWRRSPSRVHNELARLVSAGLSPYEALVAGTRNTAQYLGWLDSAGTVAVGKRADLVLLTANPLEDIRHAREPAGVMLGGRWFDRMALDHGLIDPPQTPGAALPSWLVLELAAGGTLTSPPQSTEAQKTQRAKLEAHFGTFEALTDSLTLASWSESERLLHRQAEAIKAMRDLLTPEQQAQFDPVVRMWLRVQARKGYRPVVPGVQLTP
jgi:hypothetical protein